MISVSGKYSVLENEFVLATFTDNEADPPAMSKIEACGLVALEIASDLQEGRS